MKKKVSEINLIIVFFGYFFFNYVGGCLSFGEAVATVSAAEGSRAVAENVLAEFLVLAGVGFVDVVVSAGFLNAEFIDQFAFTSGFTTFIFRLSGFVTTVCRSRPFRRIKVSIGNRYDNSK